MFSGNFIKEFENLRFGVDRVVLHVRLGTEPDDGGFVETDVAGKVRSELSGYRGEGFGKFFRMEDRVDVDVGVRKIGGYADGYDGDDSEPFVFSGVAESFKGGLGYPGGKVGSDLIGSGTHAGWEKYGRILRKGAFYSTVYFASDQFFPIHKSTGSAHHGRAFSIASLTTAESVSISFSGHSKTSSS